MNGKPSLPAFLAAHPNSVLVEVAEARGSTPREAGAFMVVADNRLFGTIGGGHLEYIAIDHARAMLAGQAAGETLDIPLGPEIGQCCGGRTLLRFTKVDETVRQRLLRQSSSEQQAYHDIFLFGAGHVGLALAAALAPLPFNVTVVETRQIEAGALPDAITFRHVPMPEAEVAAIRPGGAAVILTHDHALDFLIAREALARDDLAYTGMIGSATKRATFSRWLLREGGEAAWLERLRLPVGGDTVKDKRPAVIAALVTAELVTRLLGSQPSAGLSARQDERLADR
ncbi:xanthine dehydrogenase accessory protein XdhC [Rhizobium sp. ACO-34A]|nr:xanthine dehydrogenase accessory protein XdhC [Rhizobium sp. ACO-34A]ATN35177.1 xanthine dehydrogenase accessory protein XdhC [Rhizobium sp. ACO-34A]